MNEETLNEKSFLQVKSIRTSSNAFMMKLKEGDVIIALDGEMVHKSYEELSKELSEIKEKKVITIFRDGVFFNTFIFHYYFFHTKHTLLMNQLNFQNDINYLSQP